MRSSVESERAIKITPLSLHLDFDPAGTIPPASVCPAETNPIIRRILSDVVAGHAVNAAQCSKPCQQPSSNVYIYRHRTLIERCDSSRGFESLPFRQLTINELRLCVLKSVPSALFCASAKAAKERRLQPASSFLTRPCDELRRPPQRLACGGRRRTANPILGAAPEFCGTAST